MRVPIPKAELMQTRPDDRNRRGRHRLLFRRRLAWRRGGPQRRRPAADPRPHQIAARRPGSVRPRDDLEVAVGRQHPGERRERHRQRALGPRRPGVQPTDLQADGRGARQGKGLRLDLSQHRRAARLCRARARLQERGLPRLQDPSRTISGTPRRSSRRRGVRPISRPTSRPSIWCARRSVPTTCSCTTPGARTCRWRRPSRSAASSKSSTTTGTSTRCRNTGSRAMCG